MQNCTPLSHPHPDHEHEDLCGICQNIVKDNDKAIECNKCHKWIHIKCNKITAKQYRQFQENPNEIFECKNCNKCGVCNKIVATNHHAIECNLCLKWVHIKCNKLDKKDYETFKANENKHFFCINCLADSLPLLNLDSQQFDLTSQGIDFPEDIDINEIFLSPNQLQMIKKINEAVDNSLDLNSDINDTDNDYEVHPIDCKYYTTDQFNAQKLNSIKHFSILHLNIHSLEFHIEELRIVLKLLNLKFDFICLTESKIRKNI